MRITKYKTLMSQDRLPTLVKEKATNYTSDKLDQPAKIVSMLKEVFKLHLETEEHVYLMCFNEKLVLIGVFELSHGTVNASVCNPREIFVKTLLCNASKVAIAHNHPSGDASPSGADIDTAKRIADAGNLVGVALIDSLIVTDNEYCSLKEMGAL